MTEEIICEDCGRKMTYNPYQNFWGCICESERGGLLGLIRDIFLDNLQFELNKSCVYPFNWNDYKETHGEKS